MQMRASHFHTSGRGRAEGWEGGGVGSGKCDCQAPSRSTEENPFLVMIFAERRLCEAALTLKQTGLDGRAVKLLCSPQRSSGSV